MILCKDDRPRAIDRFIDYFGEPVCRSVPRGGGTCRETSSREQARIRARDDDATNRRCWMEAPGQQRWRSRRSHYRAAHHRAAS
jgi:hypothetical protein